MRKIVCVVRKLKTFHFLGGLVRRKTVIVFIVKKCLTVKRKQEYESKKEQYKKYYLKRREHLLSYQKEYWKNNPHIRTKVRNDYRVSKDSALLKSLTEEQKNEIKTLYKVAKWMESVFDQEFHVDHIIPLKHHLVCGLHVPWNLQVITASENMAKKNDFDPDSYQGLVE